MFLFLFIIIFFFIFYYYYIFFVDFFLYDRPRSRKERRQRHWSRPSLMPGATLTMLLTYLPAVVSLRNRRNRTATIIIREIVTIIIDHKNSISVCICMCICTPHSTWVQTAVCWCLRVCVCVCMQDKQYSKIIYYMQWIHVHQDLC